MRENDPRPTLAAPLECLDEGFANRQRCSAQEIESEFVEIAHVLGRSAKIVRKLAAIARRAIETSDLASVRWYLSHCRDDVSELLGNAVFLLWVHGLPGFLQTITLDEIHDYFGLCFRSGNMVHLWNRQSQGMFKFKRPAFLDTDA